VVKVNAFEALKPHALQRVQPIPAATKEFNNLGVVWPLVRAKPA